jgi:hypothetical protein
MRPLSLGLVIGIMLTACTDSQSPSVVGPPFVKIAIDGEPLPPVLGQAGCADYGLSVLIASLDPQVPDADVLEIHVSDFRRPATFALAGLSSGSFARTRYLGVSGFAYRTDSLNPGRFTVTGVDFTDSVVAGAFSFQLVSIDFPTITYHATGSFRLPFGQLFTVDNPEGTPCQAPTSTW